MRSLQSSYNKTEFGPDPARKLSANLCDIYHCCVYSEKLLMMDRGTARNMVYVIQLASRIRTDPVRKLSANLCDIYHCCVYSEKLLMMEIGTVRNM